MHRTVRYLFFCVILSCILAGCCFSLTPPSPKQLLSVFSEPFTCTVRSTLSDDGTSVTAAFVRTDTEDTLTVRGRCSDIIFTFTRGETVLSVRGNDTHPPLILQIPHISDRGAYILPQIFSVLPDETFSSVYEDDDIVVVNADGTYRAVFDHDGIPRSISYGGITADIDAFAGPTTSPA